MLVDAAALSALPEQGAHIVRVKGREIGLVRYQGVVYAVRNICPHQGGPLCSGLVEPLLGSTRTGVMEVDEARPVIACPWHGWQFHLEGGRSVWDDGYGVRTYPVQIENGRVLLQMPD